MSLWSGAAPPPSAQIRIKDIRQAMLDSLNGLQESPQAAHLRVRLLYTPDLEALWYLRSDLMTLLSHWSGESAARARLTAISGMFNGLLPAAQGSRPHRLGQ